MEAFEYHAIDARGRDRRGLLEGDTRRQIRQRLREQGLTPLSVAEVARAPTERGASRPAGRIGGADLALATRQIATLVATGSAVEQALGAVARQARGRRQRAVLLALRARVVEGHALSDALAAFPASFSPVYVATVAAGERSGRLAGVLEGLADHLERRTEFSRTVGMALLYPAVLTTVAVAVLAGMLGYVVPRLVTLFEGASQALPWLTRQLIVASTGLREHGPTLLLAVIVLALAWRALLVLPAVRLRVHRLWLQIPAVGRLVRALEASRFAGTLAVLVNSGVPLVEALGVARAVVRNLVLRRAVEAAARRVAEGESLGGALGRGGSFPPVLIALIESGEAGGRLEAVLARGAEAQAREARALTDIATGLLEPLLTLVMGVLVLLIVMAIALPLFELNRLAG